MFQQQVKRCFNTPGGPAPSEVASESASTMQAAYAAGTRESEPAKAADAAKASEAPIADRNPPPLPKKKRLEKGQGSKAGNIEPDALADILLTPVNEKMAADDLEKLREEMVKQASALQQQRAEVLNLI